MLYAISNPSLHETAFMLTTDHCILDSSTSNIVVTITEDKSTCI